MSTIATAPSRSDATLLAALPQAEQERLLGLLPEAERPALRHEWRFWARPAQLPPDGEWSQWLFLAGRGSGKTRAGAEWVRHGVERGLCRRVGLVAPTAADARDVMIEGESGLLAVCPDDFRPHYEPTKRRLTWPNGAIATHYSADEPERFRGPQHDRIWCDELAAWRYPDDAYNLIMLGLRLGQNPQIAITTTPKPIPLVRKLLDRAKDPEAGLVLTRGTTLDNRDHLAPGFVDDILAYYRGTRLERQEILGEYLEDIPGALWSRQLIDTHRVTAVPTDLSRTVIGVDPATSTGDDADATGIVVAALCADPRGPGRHFYVLDDLTCRESPERWGARVAFAYHKWKANLIVAESNQGGKMVGQNLRIADARLNFRLVRATTGKRVRAEPIAHLYERGLVHHVRSLPTLEDEMTSFTPDTRRSPDRLDALVWALTELAFGTRTRTVRTGNASYASYAGHS